MTKHGLEAQLNMYARSLMGQTEWRWPVSASDWRAQARTKLAEGPWGYVDGGAGDESTMRANRAAFERWQIRPRLLRNVEDRDLAVTLFGHTFPTPFLLAPIGVQSIIHPEADLASARAGAKHHIPFILSTVSSVDIETIAHETMDAVRWFQLYPGRDADVVLSFIHRAETAGYSALVVTVDTTMLGWREQDLKNLYLPFLQGQGIANFLSDPAFRSRLRVPPEENLSAAIQEFLSIYVNPAFTWDDLSKIRAQTHLPLLVKGITHPEDVREAVQRGADGVIISNHGGRQVDGSVTTLDALVDARAVVGDSYPLLLDSGIRHAADVVKALALGANAVLIGRPYAYALAVGGQAGVDELLTQWTAELDLQLALSGHRAVRDVNRHCVQQVRE